MPTSHLADLPDSALWSSLTWTDFARATPRARAATLVVLPVFGFADWGLGRPLDLEETLGTAVLRRALAAAEEMPRRSHVLVLPPLRFVLGPYPHCSFGIDFDTALDLLVELARSVKATGYRRLALFTTSPWNEELIDVGGRTMRVRLGIQAFQIALSTFGIDLHPLRSPTRDAAQHAACACYRCEPANDVAPGHVALASFRPGEVVQPGPVPLRVPLGDAIALGDQLLAEAGRRMVALWREILTKPPLPHDGRVVERSAPTGKAKKRR